MGSPWDGFAGLVSEREAPYRLRSAGSIRYVFPAVVANEPTSPSAVTDTSAPLGSSITLNPAFHGLRSFARPPIDERSLTLVILPPVCSCYERLFQVTQAGAWDEWVLFFLAAIAHRAKANTTKRGRS